MAGAQRAVAGNVVRDNRAARPELCRGHYEKNGIGADYIDQLFR